MNLVTDWRLVLKRAWSIRFNLLSATSAGAAAMLPYTDPCGSAFAALSAILAGCAALFAGLSAFSRVIHQNNVRVIRQVR